MKKLYNKIKRVVDKIKRVVEFIPIIWNSHDWDYIYAIELFKYQLNRTATFIENHGIHLNKDNDVNRIRTAVNLINRAYIEEYQDEQDDFTNDSFTSLNECEVKRVKAKKILWPYLGHNIENWWD